MECGYVSLSANREERLFIPTQEKHFGAGPIGLSWEHPRVLDYVRAAASSDSPRDREAHVEAALNIELRRSDKATPLRHNRAIGFPPDANGGVPYQVPVPIAASGPVTASVGHIDVLGRHTRGGLYRLRVFELKRPGSSDSLGALEQAVAYAASLQLLLERDAPYLRLFGFQKPPKLEATAFILDSEDNRNGLEATIARLSESNRADILLSAILYEWNSSADRSLTHIETL